VLGKAKVISYKDLEEARAKRAIKDATKEAKGKGKRGRKRKSCTLKEEEVIIDKVKQGRKRKSICARGKGKGRGARARTKCQDGADKQSASSIESLSDTNTNYGR
jgi:hypothetical protein